MSLISNENRIKIIKIHYGNGRSIKITYRKTLDIFGRYNRPFETAIKNLVNKFESTSSVHSILTTHVHPGHSAENISVVSESIEEDSNLSIPRRSQ